MKVRAFVLARDGGVCQVGLAGCTTVATEAHHVQGWRITGDDPQYLVASCRHCNGKIGDPTRMDPPARPDVWW